MMGHHFGVPYHRELQRRIILEALDLVVTANQSGDIRMLPLKWADARIEGKKIAQGLGREAD